MSDAENGIEYVIRVEGVLGERWSTWFAGFDITDDGSVTELAGRLADQAALYGLLTKIQNLGLSLISVRRVVDGTQRDEDAGTT
jgi:hypothetical protein